MKKVIWLYWVSILFFAGCNYNKKIQHPNIVWLIAEDLSQDVGAYGNNLVQTPNIDALAKKGVKFTNVYTTAPVCSPSRTALAVGMYQTSIGAYHMRYPDSLKPALPDSVQTMMDILQAHGYATANIKDEPGNGKIDWMFQFNANDQFDYNHWSELVKQDKPFFAQVNFKNTHRNFPQGSRDPNYLKQMPIPPYYPKDIVSEEDWADYYQSINVLDNKVGQILDTLKARHLDKNTIVVFFSDHGRPMTRAKMFNYDSGLQIPMAIYIPKQVRAPKQYKSGKTDDQLISAIDITATTLQMAGVPKPEVMQGRFFWGKNRDPERKYIFSATDRIGESHLKSRSVRSKGFRYIRNYRHNFSVNSAATAYRKAHHPIYQLLNILNEKNDLTPMQKQLVEPLPPEELYDLRKDPFETHNLAGDDAYHSTLLDMRKVLDDWITRTSDQGMNPDSPAIIEAFKDYGKQSQQRYKEQIKKLHDQVLNKLNAAKAND